MCEVRGVSAIAKIHYNSQKWSNRDPAGVPMTDATLTSHGLCKGGSRNIKGQNGMCRLLCLIEDFGMASLKNWVHKTLSSRPLARPSIPYT
jgi:hypothetical protein